MQSPQSCRLTVNNHRHMVRHAQSLQPLCGTGSQGRLAGVVMVTDSASSSWPLLSSVSNVCGSQTHLFQHQTHQRHVTRPHRRPASRRHCSDAVAATTVTTRTLYHLTTTRLPRPASRCHSPGASRPGSDAVCTCTKDDKRSAGLWVGRSHVVDVRIAAGVASLATSAGEQCARCGDVISSSELCCRADVRLFHGRCFTCAICRSSLLTDDQFYVVHGLFYCKTDFSFYTSSTSYKTSPESCDVCSDVITDYVLRALGKSYHVTCFRCTACHRTLHTHPFTVDIHTAPYCIDDYFRIYAPKCDACHEPITSLVQDVNAGDDQRVAVHDKLYHPQCFHSLQDRDQRLINDDRHHRHHLDNDLSCFNCTRPGCLSASDSQHNVTWYDEMGVSNDVKPLLVDVTLDTDVSSTCAGDDVSDDVHDHHGDQQQQPPSSPRNCSSSEDSGHCSSGASDVTVTSSDTETLDAESNDDDDDDAAPSTLGRHGNDETPQCVTYDSHSVILLLSAASRVTDL